MKKIFVLIMCCLLLFTSCDKAEKYNDYFASTVQQTEKNEKEPEFCGLWLTYSELSVKGKNYTEKSYSEYIGKIFDSAKQWGVTDVFVHARAFGDALYFSSVFPHSEYASGKRGKKAEFDILKICISEGEKRSLKIHAWINPYRISSSFKADYLCKGTLKDWYEKNTGDVFEINGGLYLNPTSEKAKKLVADSVREIMSNYNVAGIHFDDYFYPENCSDADKKNFEEYRKKGGTLFLQGFRHENVNSLVSLVYALVKSFGEEKIFSISPSGDIDKNIDGFYADVALWCKGGYCDMIIPQLYFGFENETMPFEKTLDKWCDLCEGSSVRLAVGLALYKIGKEDEFAGAGKYEWLKNSDIISRQIEMLKEKEVSGYALFSASYLKF